MFDGITHGDVGIVGAFRFHVADGGESILQRTASGLRSENRAVRKRPLEDLFVVLPWFLITLQKYMCMRIHQAGRACLSAQINESCTQQLGKIRPIIRDRTELAFLNSYQRIVPGLIRRFVYKRTAANECNLVSLLGVGRGCGGRHRPVVEQH